MVLCGFVALAITAAPLMDARPLLFHASSTVEASAESHAYLDPKADEWPLMVAKQAETGQPPEPYVIEVAAGKRRTRLIGLTVSSNSPERAQAMATWLGKSFVSSLRQSYASREFAPDRPPRVWGVPDSLPIASRWSITGLAFQLFVPSLLIVGGTILFRTRRDNRNT